MMRRSLPCVVAALIALTASSRLEAQGQDIVSKPIDTNKLLVQPTQTATNIFSRTTNFASRTFASVIDSNGFVRTFNKILGRTQQPNVQPGLSALPSPSLYPSTSYPNSFKPVLPSSHKFGESPRLP